MMSFRLTPLCGGHRAVKRHNQQRFTPSIIKVDGNQPARHQAGFMQSNIWLILQSLFVLRFLFSQVSCFLGRLPGRFMAPFPRRGAGLDNTSFIDTVLCPHFPNLPYSITLCIPCPLEPPFSPLERPEPWNPQTRSRRPPMSKCLCSDQALQLFHEQEHEDCVGSASFS